MFATQRSNWSSVRSTLSSFAICLLAFWHTSHQAFAQDRISDFAHVASPSLFKILEALEIGLPLDPSIGKLTLEGQVVDQSGKSVPDAIVTCWAENWKSERVIVGKTRSKQDGFYSMDASRLRMISEEYQTLNEAMVREHAEKEWSSAGLYYMGFPLGVGQRFGFANRNLLPVQVLAVSADDRMGQSHPRIAFSRSVTRCNVSLLDTEAGLVVGSVLDAKRAPMPNVEVSLGWLSPIATLTPHILLPSGLLKTTTDSEGNFAFRNLPSNYGASIRLGRNGLEQTKIDLAATTEPVNREGYYKMIKSNPVQLVFEGSIQRTFTGKIVGPNEEPLENVLVKVDQAETRTNASGEYKMEVPATSRTMRAIMADDSDLLFVPQDIYGMALLKGEPQPTRKALQGTWVSGRVVSTGDGTGVKDILIHSEKSYCGRVDADGFFRVLVFSDKKQIRLIPTWLSRPEQMMLTYDKDRFHPITITSGQALDLGTLQLKLWDQYPGINVKVTLPNGAPAVGANVRLWSSKLNSDYHTLRVSDNWKMTATTDTNGTCRLHPAMRFEGEERISVTYPEIDPQYFGEVVVDQNQSEAIVELIPAHTVRGTVKSNGQAFPSVRLRARTVGKDYKTLHLEGVSDSAGAYEVIVPEADVYEIEILDLGDRAIGDTTKNFSKNHASVTEGPAFEVLSGSETISGRVLGKNGKGYSGATVYISPIEGKIIVGTIIRPSDGLDGEFRIGGLPEGEFELLATIRPPADTPKEPESESVKARAGDKDVQIKMLRNSR